ncbi:Inner membrane transport protein YajR [Candidatus Venteria ishoeyi]|uniref:Inner membrane transport protein YajR n=2 Tax=Candidatus Venteria ishoeyi TaxID=1899563 RepID=A0A1H6FET3_9GAMM|nr:Inner membrane transport protein YajR [Candidatus Venteria ishoeyi]
MTPIEKRASTALSGIMALRMLGLFMILPVFSLYAQQLPDVTPTLIGLAIGIYGLTQGLLQIPFGLLSDRIGRKPVIIGGLLIFALGSVVAAQAQDIWMIIVGRGLQGAGAIAAALMALTADLTREEHRMKAMATIGMSIGMAFLLAMIAGPIINQWIGVPGIFWLIAAGAIGGIGIVIWVVPTPLHTRVHRDAETVPAQLGQVLKDAQLLRLDVGILTLHAQLTALFVVFPLALHNNVGLAVAEHWKVYLPVMLLSIISLIPLVIYAEKYRHIKLVFSAMIALLTVTSLAFSGFHNDLWVMGLLLWLFFTAFNVLESILPSLVSKIAPPDNKGTAMGMYSTSQFLGAFIGGLCGGWLYHHSGFAAVFWFCAGINLIWLLLAVTMRQPTYFTSYLLKIAPMNTQEATVLHQQLIAIEGVAQAVVICEDEVAYLKIDSKKLNFSALDAYSV